MSGNLKLQFKAARDENEFKKSEESERESENKWAHASYYKTRKRCLYEREQVEMEKERRKTKNGDEKIALLV